jgi:hypothetical protein
VVQKITNFLLENGKVEGIFRQSGNDSLIDAVKKQIDGGDLEFLTPGMVGGGGEGEGRRGNEGTEKEGEKGEGREAEDKKVNFQNRHGRDDGFGLAQTLFPISSGTLNPAPPLRQIFGARR